MGNYNFLFNKIYASKNLTILTIFLIIILVIACWKIFEKAGIDGWISIIPFLNTYYLYKIAFGNGWLFLLGLIPFVNVVMYIIFNIKLAKAFNKGGLITLCLIFLPFIGYCILGFGKSTYKLN